MSLIHEEDGGGASIEIVLIDGHFRLSTFLQRPDVISNRFKSIPAFKCRDDDVFVFTPPKSGTHWTWEIVSMLLNGNANTIPKSKMEHMLESTPHETIQAVLSPRVLNTHVNYKYLPREAIDKGCKIVYVLRNPKDVAVSFYHHTKGLQALKYNGKWENFLPLFIDGKAEYGSWFDFVLEMEQVMREKPYLPIHLIYYENMKVSLLEEVYRLGQFLGVDNPDGLYEAIAKKCQFHNMRNDKAPTAAVSDVMFKGNFTMYRKGDVGDWKNWFTVAQNEHFDKVYAEKMKHSKLVFQYEYTRKPIT